VLAANSNLPQIQISPILRTMMISTAPPQLDRLLDDQLPCRQRGRTAYRGMDVSSNHNVGKLRKSHRGTTIIYWLLPDAYIDQYDWTARSNGRGYSQISAQATFLSAYPAHLDKAQKHPKKRKTHQIKYRWIPITSIDHYDQPMELWPSGYGASFR
jgi:hypothetical protein